MSAGMKTFFGLGCAALCASAIACGDKKQDTSGSPASAGSAEMPAAIPTGYPLPAKGRSLRGSTIFDGPLPERSIM